MVVKKGGDIPGDSLFLGIWKTKKSIVNLGVYDFLLNIYIHYALFAHVTRWDNELSSSLRQKIEFLKIDIKQVG